MNRAALVLLLLPSLAFASVGKIAVVEGKATRTPKGGQAVALAAGSEVEVGDVLDVPKGGNLKLQLNDESVIMLGEASQLTIDEASFSGQDRKGFFATLNIGKFWTKVSKAVGGSSKFEVKTGKAVAGVRGTIFRIDSKTLLAAANSTAPKRMVSKVAVTQGVVQVDAPVKKAAAGALPQKGPRKQVPGPQQISLDEWEQKFVQLQANQMVIVGEDLWQEAAIDPKDSQDAFGRFVKKNE
ncbi:MAG: FecR family protein [Myxococcaceae bacterium]